jgi:CRISPR-associated protein Cmr3
MVNHHDRPEGHTWVGLSIEPLDVLFFRDGRPFNASSRAEGGLPVPRTLAGAVRTAVLAATGFDFREFARRLTDGMGIPKALREGRASQVLIDARFRGPWLGRFPNPSQQPQTVYLNPPANLYQIRPSKDVFRADPLSSGKELPGWDPGTPPRQPLWRDRQGPRGKPRPLEGFFVTLAGIDEFLKGKVPQSEDQEHLIHHSQLYNFDHRVNVAIEADSLTGAEGQLFATRLICLREHVGFYAEMSWNPSFLGELKSALSAPIPWGGEGRHARVRVTESITWPSHEDLTPGKTAVYLLATPGVFQTPERAGPMDPDRLRQGGARVVASASTGPLAVSGWDVARKAPRPTRFAAPAGTVYFAQNSIVPGQVSLCSDDELVAEGWGFALRGVIADVR